jgi:hypothetical protein
MKHAPEVSRSLARLPKLLSGVALAAPLLTFSLSSGQAASVASSPLSIISGSVRSANGTPVAGDVVTFYPADPPSDGTMDWQPAPLGHATTDAKGIWTFTVPSYGSLPAATRTEAAANNGWLNLVAIGFGKATVGATSYGEKRTPLGPLGRGKPRLRPWSTRLPRWP